MTAVILDTCALTRMVSGVYAPPIPFYISIVTFAEGLRAADAENANDIAREVSRLVQDIEERFILPFWIDQARTFARIAPKVSSPKKASDLMIVATAIEASMKLVSADGPMVAIQASMPVGLRFSIETIP